MVDGAPACCISRRPATNLPASERSASTITPRVAPAPHRWSDPIGGTFMMGSKEPGRFPADGEGPARRVTVTPFAIARHAVTNAQFAEFVRDTGYTTDAERAGWSFVFEGAVTPDAAALTLGRAGEAPWWLSIPHAYWAQPEGAHSSVLDRLDHPVVHVSWDDAKTYCAWAHARLPTEAEWELAARGGLQGALYPWGNELTPDAEHRCNIWQGKFPSRNTEEDGFIATAPVDAFLPNGYGLHNIVGNAWEWCEDFFAADYHRVTAAENPVYKTPTSSRSLRGGSFLCHESYCNRYRVAARSSNTPDSSASNIGFRAVLLESNAKVQ